MAIMKSMNFESQHLFEKIARIKEITGIIDNRTGELNREESLEYLNKKGYNISGINESN